MSALTRKDTYTLVKACAILGYSLDRLSKESGVGIGVIRRIVAGNSSTGVHEDTAARLASALGLDRDELNVGTSLSPYGRPPTTGVPTKKAHPPLRVTICSTHRLEHHMALPCPYCSDV